MTQKIHPLDVLNIYQGSWYIWSQLILTTIRHNYISFTDYEKDQAG